MLLILLLFAAEILRDFHPVKLSILFVAIWHVPLLALHEAAHALAARWLGWGVRRVVIGFGRPLHKGRVREVDVEIRLAPVLGFTVVYPRSERLPRTKHLLVYFAGPASALLVLGAVILLVGWDDLITSSDSVGVILVQSLAIAATVDAITNLIPMITPGPEGDFAPTDGMGMILALRRPRIWYRQQIARWRQVEAGIMREPTDGL
ncbi:MAG: site-2 protease family protein [Polyangia bacterium]|nr:site-2 protease family protein [Polyangia bacterium]